MNSEIYNFSAGPAMIPKKVLNIISKNIKNWNNLGVSIIEISHRFKDFIDMFETAKKNLKKIMNIPENYKILFCSGGARAQFYAVPMNLLNTTHTANYINSGYWSKSAFIESQRLCSSKLINVRRIKDGKHSILPMQDWKINNKTSYIHYCQNETIEGISIYERPNFNKSIAVIADFSSSILSRKINIKDYGIIYASAQKNIGPSGVTIVIIREDLIKTCNKHCPSILNYQTILKNKSMFNTPVTFSLYVASLVFEWIKKMGGIKEIEKINEKKSNLLYKTIDDSSLYTNSIAKKNRSSMNVSFFLKDERLNELFLKKTHKNGLLFLKGHSSIGGMRASIYNAMTFNGVKKLSQYMKYFEKKYG
ncbi:3-phosphoserine/phosphohydroxythreonine transaminase [Buchnera aphidicola]|uniref:Phosphoserine aminotransferase n=1 Tax=Buchnera aphidicola (Anoecia oenotherae) TaxID=1241833 RepID=A0A4D6XZD2_9GAMM|nr:3-phosphoserine/phosphohydroxythreonine transaminase [Buchnera aphidicola]QCI19370.1 3-phosphoserine/phosphohydroxythreonine transaminase [Buchnera aphidicola (Anoecia oenotherae)]